MRRPIDPIKVMVVVFTLWFLCMLGLLYAQEADGAGVPDEGALLALKDFTYTTALNTGEAPIYLTVKSEDGRMTFWQGRLMPNEKSNVFAVATNETFQYKWVCQRCFHARSGKLTTAVIGHIVIKFGTGHDCVGMNPWDRYKRRSGA